MPTNNIPFWRQPWTIRSPAFALTDSLFYVGNANVSCHLIRSERGWVLLDTAFAQTTYLLTESIRSLGVDPAEIALIIHSHGHVDHCGATRRLKELSGAETAIGEAEVETVERGTPVTCAEYLYGINDFETFAVDRPLKHGDVIDLGDTALHCHHTPGHTPGVITYTWEIEVDGGLVTAGMFGGPGLWTMTDQHTADQGYPGNRDDFANSLVCLRDLPIELWLGAHPGQNDTFGKFLRLDEGEQPNPFIDPDGWRQFIEGIQTDFDRMRQASAGNGPG